MKISSLNRVLPFRICQLNLIESGIPELGHWRIYVPENMRNVGWNRRELTKDHNIEIEKSHTWNRYGNI